MNAFSTQQPRRPLPLAFTTLRSINLHDYQPMAIAITRWALPCACIRIPIPPSACVQSTHPEQRAFVPKGARRLLQEGR